MSPLRRTLVPAILLAALATARGADASDVGVVATRADDPFAARLILELEQLGFAVTRERRLVASSRELVIVKVSERELELHEVGSDGSLQRRTMAATRADALKAAEEVRAVLVPLVARAPRPPATPADPETREPASPPPQEASVVGPPASRDATIAAPVPPRPHERAKLLEAGAGGAALFGGSTPGAALALSLVAFPRGLRAGRASLGIGLGGLAAIVTGSVSAAQGSADVRAILAGPEVVGRLELVGPLSLGVSLGAWATHLRVSGSATPPFTSRDDAAWSVSPTARVRLHYQGRSIGIFAEGRSGLAIPAIAIRFDGATVQEWGPWGSLGAGATFAF